MKNLIAALVLAAITTAMWAAQTWLETRRFDRAEFWLISGFAGSMIGLVIALVIYFGRIL
jgi:hypothetical protein